jgi:hypothetical protein
LFKKYLQDKGWTIVATKEDKDSSAIGAKKNNASLDFGFTKASAGVIVDISFSVK